MYKKTLLTFIIVFTIFFCVPITTKAITSAELAARNVCGSQSFEVALALSDKNLSKVSCHSTYTEALQAMEDAKSTVSSVAVILERTGGVTSLINAKYALANLHRGNYTTNIYSTSSLSSAYTYVNANKSLGGVDAAFININYSNKAARIKISGYTGWVKKDQYQIVPLSWVQSSNIYKVLSSNDGIIKHCYTNNLINTSSNPSCVTIGPKPSMLDYGDYYSFDGIYMYNSLITLLEDYRNNTYNNAVNKDKPYYNYYLYLPHHTKTTYSSIDIDSYIRSLGYKEKIYNGSASSGQSMLYGEGTFFYQAQQLYGANALLMFGVARNESGNGRSAISIDKNNLFGHGAADSNPYYGATGYITVKMGIYRHAFSYVLYGYNSPSDWRYFGAVLGTKQLGFNVKYASDPYWGEKAAGHYFTFDNANGMQDYNYYQLAVQNITGNVSVYQSPNTTSTVLYKMNSINSPVVIVEEIEGTIVQGSSKWYKIISDANLSATGKVAYNSSTMPEYEWDTSYAYVPSYYFNKVNDPEELHDPKDVIEYKDSNYIVTTYYNSVFKVLEPKVGIINKDSNVYYDVSLTEVKESIKKSAYVTVIEKAINEDDEIVAYLISYNASRNTREWISASDITITQNTYGMINANGVEVKSSANGSTTYGKVYANTFVAVLEEKSVSNSKWVKISYDANEKQTGWVLASKVNYISGNIIVENPGETLVSFNGMNYISDSVFEISGSLVITGMNITKDRELEYSLVLIDENDSTKEFIYNLDRWNEDYPYDITNGDKFDYSGGWFKSKVDFKELPNGNYIMYVKIKIDDIERKVLFRNIALKDMTKRVNDTTNLKGFELRTDYYSKDVVLNLFVRKELLSNRPLLSYQNMFNTYFEMKFNNDKLNILGNAFNINGNYTKDDTVTRKIVLENTTTFEKYYFENINEVLEIPYDITLSTSDKNLTKAWYLADLDIKDIPVGKYSIYVITKSGDIEDYGEIYDIAFRNNNISTVINNKKYEITRNDSIRYRLELTVIEN